MTALSAYAETQLVRHAQATKHYATSTTGLSPDAAIISYVESQLKNQAPSPEDEEKFLELVRDGKGQYSAARSVGWDPMKLHGRLQVDDEFAERLRVAKIESLEPVLEQVRNMATDPIGDSPSRMRAAMKLMESYDPATFGPQKQDVSVNVNSFVDESDPIIREIRMLAAEVTANRQMKQIGPNVIDIPDSDIQEI